MALPLSIAKAGIVLGPLLILFVAVLSSITIDILARCQWCSSLHSTLSCCLQRTWALMSRLQQICGIDRASERTGKWTFGELVDTYLGRTGSQTLRFFIFVNNGGG